MDKDIYEIVKKHIDTYDYMGLLSSGCPLDEYDIESRHISKSISANCSVYETAEVIARTFEVHFNNPEKPDSFIELAKRIHLELTKNQKTPTNS